MPSVEFTIALSSDAEPGTGLGGKLTNSMIPRNRLRQPILNASHIKGLMRDLYRKIKAERDWNDEACLEREKSVFGVRGSELLEDDAVITLEPAVARGTYNTQQVTRTAISEHGVAIAKTLRTSETIASGTEFTGQVVFRGQSNSAEDLLWRLVLLGLPAVGGNRTRGSGRCFVSIEDEQRSPGQLLRLLDQEIRQPKSLKETSNSLAIELGDEIVFVELIFRARTPVCLPELPDKTNVITTGFTISASAVQGLILTRLNSQNPALANALFANSRFRAWPMQPCWSPTNFQDTDSPSDDDLPWPIRVSLSHQVAKYSTTGTFSNRHFFDRAIEPENKNRVVDGAPLKSADGVLLKHPGKIALWRNSDMPQEMTAHGVHFDPGTGSTGGRNLFSVNAMAPMIWRGLVAMPKEAAEQLQASFGKDSQVSIGKSRTVRGQGRLSVRISNVAHIGRSTLDQTILVAQSPLLLPDDSQGMPAEKEFIQLFASVSELGLPQITHSWAKSGILFGWNRKRSGIQPACRVILPGSVVRFESKISEDQLRRLFLSSSFQQEGRQRGYGALAAHPGKADTLYEPRSEPQAIQPRNDSQATIYRQLIRLQSKANRLPSVSQVRAVQQELILGGIAKAKSYLDQQQKKTVRIWNDWQECIDQINGILDACQKSESQESAVRGLEFFADLIRVRGDKSA